MTSQSIFLLLAIGLIAGVLSGLIGIGGGIIIVPALIYLVGYSQHEAQGTSLGLLLLPIGIFATLNYYRKGYIDMKAILIMAGTFTIGGLLGSKLSLSISDVLLKRIFAASLIVIGVKMLFFDK
jgi:uncharacterized membrane protein YfcA